MSTRLRKALLLVLPVLLGFGLSARAQQALLQHLNAAPNLLSNGGFEASKPAYWEPDGTGAVWSWEHARTPGYSLELTGAGEAAWVMPEAIRNWVAGLPGGENPALELGGWVRTLGVNTAPASEAEKFQLVFELFDAAGANLLGQALVLDVPQESPSTDGWVELSSLDLGAITLPSSQAAKSVKITFRKGASATGSAYLDDVFVRKADPEAPGWAGGFFNPNMDASDTWYYWWDAFDTGSASWPEAQPFVQTVTNEEAHTGSRSLKIMQHDPAASEAVAISERVPVVAGQPVLVSYWVKYEGNEKPEEIATGDNNLGLTALFYNQLESGAAGYGEIGGLDIRLNGEYNPNVIPLLPKTAEAGWTQYAFVVYPREGAVGMELRLRYWHSFTGTTYWDDVFIAPVPDVIEALPNSLSNGGFEASKPAYWEPDGTGAVWSWEHARTPGYSLELTGAGEAAWVMPEAIRNWVAGLPGGENPALELGGWVRTLGVNTAPASEAEKFQLVFELFDAAGANLLGQALVLDVPQESPSTDGWVELSSLDLGAITLPSSQAAKSVKITFRKGASATGSAYLDDVFVRKADPEAPGWAGGFFNPNMDASDTWYYWWDAFDTGSASWPEAQPFVQTVTNEEAHTGSRSLKIMQHDPAASEAVAISERVPVVAGQPVLVSYWVKYEGNEKPEEIATGDNNLGLTALFYNQLESGAAGYGEIGGLDIRLNGEYNPNVIPLLPKTAEAGWTQYAFVVYPREGAVGMELRLRYWHSFTGTTYWDDVAVIPLGGDALTPTDVDEEYASGEVPGTMLLHQNYPNPFNPSTTIAFGLPQPTSVTLSVYNTLGQRVAELIGGETLRAGTHTVAFDASGLPSGLYVYVLKTDRTTEARKMLLLK